MKNTIKTLVVIASVSMMTVSCGVSDSLQNIANATGMNLVGSEEGTLAQENVNESTEIQTASEEGLCAEECKCGENGEGRGKREEKNRPNIFAEMDKDADGFVTVEEWNAKHEEMRLEHEDFLAKLDLDKDGSLSAEELAKEERELKHLLEMDADANGSLSVEELAALDAKRTTELTERFTTLDTDKDEKVSAEEFKAGEPRKENQEKGKGMKEGKEMKDGKGKQPPKGEKGKAEKGKGRK